MAGDWFEQNAPAQATPQVSGDWFAQNKPPAPDEPDDNSLLGHAWDSFAGMFTGTAHAIAHPLDTAAGIKNEVQHHVNRASEEFHKGNISDGLAHAVAAVPLLGPMITQGGNELQQGHYRAAAGDILGTVEGANLFGKGTSKVVSAAKGIPAVADAIQTAVKDRIATGQPTVVEDILNHPEVQKAVKRAVSEAVNEIPGVRTVRAMGGVASTAKRVMTDVTATRAARNLPASPKPQTVIPGRSGYEPTFQGLPPETGEAPAPMAGAQPMEPVQPQEGAPGQFSRVIEPEPIPASPQVATPSSASPMPQQAPAAGPVPMNTDVVPESGPRMAQGTPDWFEQNAPIKPRIEVNPSELQPIAANAEPPAPEPQAQPVPEIPRIPVSQFNAGKSSNIEAIGYHPESQTMHVEFKNPKGENRVYEFTGVTPEEHSAFIKAESLGSHFARQIRPKYPTPGEMPKIAARAADAKAQVPMFAGTEVPSAPGSEAATIPPTGEVNGTQGRPAAGAGENLPSPAQDAPVRRPGQGKETSVYIPGEDGEYKARYEIRELSDIRSSHNGQTFQPNPDYAYKNDRDYTDRANQGKVVNGALPSKFKPGYLITDNPDASNGPPVIDEQGNAVGGNGRSMILQRVHAGNPEGTEAYRQMLTDKAPQFGIDPAHVQQFKQPVLVRVVDGDAAANAQNAITDLNKTGTAALTPEERALADSRRVSPKTLDEVSRRLDDLGPDANLSRVLAGEHGTSVLDKLIDDGVISPQERAAYAKEGALTKAGQERISKLLLGRFFRDPAQLDTISPNIRAKLERVAAPLAKLESADNWSLSTDVREAMDLLEEAHAHGTKNLGEFLKQSGLFGETRYHPQAVTLAKAFQRMSSGRLTDAVKQYTRSETLARQHASAKAGLFGGEVTGEAPEPSTAFEEAFSPSAKSAELETPAAKAAKPKSSAKKLGDQFLR